MKILAGLILVMSLTACSTISGFGSDVKGAADWTKEKMTGSKVDLNQNK
jgi:predicted small secreted protein